MAIVKCANRRGSTLRGLVNYVLDKSKMEYVDVYALDKESISRSSIIEQMKETKELFGKQGDREVYHIIISYHKEENITPKVANHLAMELYQSVPEFKDREALLVTQKHGKEGNIHTHIIINTVSFEDGKKLHTSRSWLQDLKDTNDLILRSNNLSVVEKGVDFHGNRIDRHEPRGTDQYMLKNKLALLSWKDNIAQCVKEAATRSISKEQFIKQLQNNNITVQWSDNRKHITYIDAFGHKLRDTRLEKDYGHTSTKDSLMEKFQENLNLELSKDESRSDNIDFLKEAEFQYPDLGYSDLDYSDSYERYCD